MSLAPLCSSCCIFHLAFPGRSPTPSIGLPKYPQPDSTSDTVTLTPYVSHQGLIQTPNIFLLLQTISQLQLNNKYTQIITKRETPGPVSLDITHHTLHIFVAHIRPLTWPCILPIQYPIQFYYFLI